MSNYNQYYYNGDTINARVMENGFAVDLTDDNVRSKMYDDEYRLGVAKQLNSIYKRKFGRESGISDNSVSLELLGHAGLYDFSTGLDGKADKAALIVSPFAGLAWNSPYALNKRKEYYDRAKEANIGNTGDKQRKLFDSLGILFH